MNRLKNLIASIALVSFICSSFVHPSLAHVSSVAKTNNSQLQQAGDDDEGKGLSFRLSEGSRESNQTESGKPAVTSQLLLSETQTILKRLPPMTADVSDEVPFRLSERTPPPSITGVTRLASFAPTTSESPSVSVYEGPLVVVSHAPEGKVDLAPHLSVSFSQPMVTLGSQSMAAATVPVKLSPQPPGEWRWLGTKTLIFQPSGRFPMATTYRVTVPSGTRSVNGNSLAIEKSWSFSTPPPTVKYSYPAKDSTQRRDALMFVAFDQRIDPLEVLKTIKVRAGNGILKTRLATAEELAQESSNDREVTTHLHDSHKDRGVAFRVIDATTGKPDQALPADSKITVSIGPGAPSAEGTQRTATSYDFSFRTHGPLVVTKHDCDTDDPCNVYSEFSIELSNGLDQANFSESMVKLEPRLEDMDVSGDGNYITIRGSKRGRTTYRVTLDPSIKDQFNQTLQGRTTFSFRVGPAPQSFEGPARRFIVLDPAGPPRVSVFSTNYPKLDVRLYSVTPDDWPRWIEYRRADNRKQLTPPGRVVFSKIVPIKPANDEIVETSIDLSPGLNGEYGQMILSVKPLGRVKKSSDRDDDDEDDQGESWIQRTEIALDAFVDQTNLIGWVTSLKDGSPLSGVDVALLPYRLNMQTVADGLVRFSLRPESKVGGRNLLIARRNNDVAILPDRTEDWNQGGGSWFRSELQDTLRWHVFDDRKMYQPGEDVHLKGWIRRINNNLNGDVSFVGQAVQDVTYVLKDSQSNPIRVGTLRLNSFGAFDTVLRLPKETPMGRAHLELQALTGLFENRHTHFFEVQQFRRPEFEIKTTNHTNGPAFVSEAAEVSVQANYYAGGGLPNAPVKWHVISSAGEFTPPNRSDFTFGVWKPWWIRDYHSNDAFNSQTFSSSTDAAGEHRLRIDFESVKPSLPATVTASASVTDVNRQTWSARTTLLVHPANVYVGLKSERTFVQKGEPLVVQTIVSDLDGQLVAAREIKMSAFLLDWRSDNKGEWTRVETNRQDCSIQSGSSPVSCDFEAAEGGEYRVRAFVTDERGRQNKSELTLWVAGGKPLPTVDIEQEELELIPNQKEYRVGDKAEILVQAPFYPAEGLLTIRRSGIVKSERFRMDGPSTTLRVPIEAAWTPNVHVQVDLVGASKRETASGGSQLSLSRPAFAKADLNLSIPPFDRRLTIKATPDRNALEPGAETNVTIEVKDAAGQSVKDSEVALVIVDEAILALTNYKLTDPMDTFYTDRDEDVNDYSMRENVVLTSLAPGEGGGFGPGAGGVVRGATIMRTTLFGAMSRMAPPPNVFPSQEVPQEEKIRVRSNFDPLAAFAASVRTDANGHANVKVTLPDSLTRYRVTAIGVAGEKQFGIGESAITARIPIMIRPSAPRFLNFGDRFELPIVIQNQTENQTTVDVAIRANGPIRFIETASAAQEPAIAGRRVTIAANDRVELRVPTIAGKSGTARFQIGAVAGRWTDAAEISLPVLTPATTESFATYGEIDEGGISQMVQAPSDAVVYYGGLEVGTASTQLQQLTDAFLYLRDYPYECAEQLSSRILSFVALRDVLTAFKVPGALSPSEVEAAVASDLQKLQRMQNADGGFSFWTQDDESWPYLSVHVAHALIRAKQNNFVVPDQMLEKSQKYLREIEHHFPSRYSVDVKWAITAYALYVRAQMGDRDTQRARRFINSGDVKYLSLETNAWLLSVLANAKDYVVERDAIKRHFSNRAVETAGAAHFASSYGDDDHLILNSERRADGIILDALIADQPDHPLIPKLVRGLLGHRTKGRWNNTQENVFILLALNRYFQTYEKVNPDFVSRVWLGEDFAGQQQFRGRDIDRHQVNVPMSYLAEKMSNMPRPLLIRKEGPGRLYYRVAMNYAPKDLIAPAVDYGFAVERVYEGVDRATDVARDADGTWRIKSGARVRVRLRMVAPSQRNHVALMDPLPAGFEIINPELAVSEKLPKDAESVNTRLRDGWWIWRRVWFDHQNLRDERAESFAAFLPAGVYDYSYVARATTPGVFIVPPAKAEEMYHPETFGRTRTERVRIE